MFGNCPSTLPPLSPSFNTTRGSLAPDRGTGSELTAAPLPSHPSPTSVGEIETAG